MNPKSATFLSATLTTFIMAVLFGVVTKISTTPKEAALPKEEQAQVQEAAPTQMPTEAPTEAPTQIPAPTAQPPLGPEEAAILAAKSLNREDVYSVEATTFNGAESYKVIFSSGDIVFIGMDRIVQNVTKLEPVIVNVTAPTTPNNANLSAGKQKNNEQINQKQDDNQDDNEDEGDDDSGDDDGGEEND